MEDFYGDWRRRLSVHAAFLLLFSVLLGFQYHQVLQYDDAPLCSASAKRVCNPTVQKSDAPCPHDDPCLPDTVMEHRWRSAHQQGLLHALLLFGFAIAAPYFRVSQPMFTLAAWLVLVGVWAAPLGQTFQALGTANPNPKLMYCLVTQDETPVTHCMANTVGAVAGIATTIGILILALRAGWEIVRDAVAPATWRNWARIVKARPRRIHAPADAAEIVTIVQDAIDAKTTVRAFGGRYSWSAIAPTDGVMIDMRRIRTVDAAVPSDPSDKMKHPTATHTVRVGAGARIRDVTEALMKQDLMLQTSTVTPWVQVGGALANGCHGTGVAHAPLVDLVTSIEIVQALDVGGQLVASSQTYHRPPDPPNPGNAAQWKEWRALIVNLGCLGVMHAVTFECVPLYDAHIVDTSMDMRDTIDQPAVLRQIIGDPLSQGGTQGRYAELFWFPFNDELFVRSWDPVSTGPHGDFPLLFWLRQWVVAKLVGPVVFFLLGLFPFLTPFLMRIFHMAFSNLDHRVRAPNAMQYERYFTRVYDMGYAVAYDPDPANPRGFELFQKAWWRVVEKLENARHQGAYPQNLVLHVRFGQESGGYLHPTRGNGFTAYMELVTHVNASRHQEHFEAVERIWHRLGGKAHWGKVNYQPDRLIEHYSPTDVSDFLDVRRAMDPGQIFLNDYVRRILHVEEP